MGRPELGGKRNQLTCYAGQLAVPNDAAPRVLNKSWSITADIDIPQSGAEGMIVTHGGITAGYGLYLRAGKPVFSYNYLARDRYFIEAQQPLPAGKTQLKMDACDLMPRQGRPARQLRDPTCHETPRIFPHYGWRRPYRWVIL